MPAVHLSVADTWEAFLGLAATVLGHRPCLLLTEGLDLGACKHSCGLKIHVLVGRGIAFGCMRPVLSR